MSCGAGTRRHSLICIDTTNTVPNRLWASELREPQVQRAERVVPGQPITLSPERTKTRTKGYFAFTGTSSMILKVDARLRCAKLEMVSRHGGRWKENVAERRPRPEPAEI